MPNPRDIRAYAGQPCSLLSTSQRTALGYDRPGRVRDSVGLTNECVLRDSGSSRDLRLAPFGDRDYLVDVYRTRLLPIFIPVDLEGFPSVAGKSSPDGIICTLTTGIANGQALETTVTVQNLENDRLGDPCQEAIEINRVILGNLPPLR